MLFIVTGIVLLIIVFFCVIHIKNKKAIDYRIRHSFGDSKRVKDDVLDRIEAISLLYKKEKKNYSDAELVDDITWDDLDMKSIFFRADHTDSYAGEQCLYSKLHILSDRSPDDLLSNSTVEFFDKNEEKRNKVRKVLYNIGKPISVENHLPTSITSFK